MSVPLVRTLVLYLAVICAVRLMGKRQLGEMDPAELVVTILVSDLAAVPMQDLGIPLFFGLVPIAALVVLEVLLSTLSLKSRLFRRLLNGQPALRYRYRIKELLPSLQTGGVLFYSICSSSICSPDGPVKNQFCRPPKVFGSTFFSGAVKLITPAALRSAAVLSRSST